MGRRVEDKDQRLRAGARRRASGRCAAIAIWCAGSLENLIDNAYKYGPRHATITVEVLPATMDDGAEPAVEIRVRDEGEGIPARLPAADLREVRAGRGTRRAAQARNSHGLGLVFCRRAVGVHGGAIWVEDGAGRGGCFCVRLPVARLPLSAARRAAARRTARGVAG